MLESNYSTPTVIQTSIWGDVVGNDSLEAPDDSVDIISDVTLTLNKFQNFITGPLKSQADVEPAEVDFQVNISDVTFVLNAFCGDPYFFTGPGDMTPPCE